MDVGRLQFVDIQGQTRLCSETIEVIASSYDLNTDFCEAFLLTVLMKSLEMR